MFWANVLESGMKYTQVISDGFHISMAALEPQYRKNGKVKVNNDSPVCVMVEQDETEILLCTLSQGRQLQQALDLNFEAGETVTLFLKGEGIVHLTGYVLQARNDQDYSYGAYDDEDMDEDACCRGLIPVFDFNMDDSADSSSNKIKPGELLLEVPKEEGPHSNTMEARGVIASSIGNIMSWFNWLRSLRWS